MVLHVRFESWFISFPASAEQQRKMKNFFRIFEYVNPNGSHCIFSLSKFLDR